MRLFYLLCALSSVCSVDVDPNGYVVFCPCMGRFGNQMDYFLGTLGFAEALNRTLVLAPWIEYKSYQPVSNQIPFDSYFRVDDVNKFHRAVTMETFMNEIAPIVWPPDRRISFCYQQRTALVVEDGGSSGDQCASKNGNPNGPFWSAYDVDFVSSELHGPLLYDTHNLPGLAGSWNSRYPARQWPVLAFAGSPASYPVLEQNAGLQRYFVWSDAVVQRSRLIGSRLPRGAFVAAHVRIGSDWKRACEHVDRSLGNMFSSAQCLGYRNQRGRLSRTLCYPSVETMARQVRRAVRHVGADSVYVATDDADGLQPLLDQLRTDQFAVITQSDLGSMNDDPHAELALLGRANLFIGNCVSSFSAVAARERLHHGLPTWYWDMATDEQDGQKTAAGHNEL